MASYYLCHEIYTPKVPLTSLNNLISPYMPPLILTALHLTYLFVLHSLKFIPLLFLGIYTYIPSSWKSSFRSFSRKFLSAIQVAAYLRLLSPPSQ